MNFINDDLKKIISYLVIIVFLILVLGLNIYHIFFDINNDNKEVNDTSTGILAANKDSEIDIDEDKIQTYKVDIKGAVKKPGVYELNEGSIVNDVIKMAGGLTSKASTKYLNLSKKISDEMVINIYTVSELNNMKNSKVDDECVCDSIDIIDCDGSSIITSDDNSSNKDDNVLESTKDELISINNATKDELMTLSGIGEAKAEDIIEYRSANGPFKKIEDLMNVSGIGESIYNKIKDYIKL